MEIVAAISTIIGFIALIGVLAAVTNIWRGFVLSILWGWFVVPVFALPPLSIPVAIGISLVVNLLTGTPRVNDGVDKEKGVAKSLAVAIIFPAIGLFIGWIVHLWL